MNNASKRTWAEIDLEALRNNMVNIKNYVGSDVQILAVVKADAYGHGAVKCAEIMTECGVSRFAVAFTDEAVQLRKHGITLPIQLLGYTPRADYDALIEYDIIPAVFSYEDAAILSETALKKGKKHKIHIKLDTGMHRIGFDSAAPETICEIAKISELEGIEIEGIFTHFSCADMPDDDYTYMQFDRFMHVVNELERINIHIPLKHVCNSAATIKHKDMHLDMVRPGIINYGLMPSECVNIDVLNLKPVMSIKTNISHIHYIDREDKISYGATFTADKKMKIATIPIGYADGFLRAFSGKIPVIAGGEFADIVGRICMDQCMIDVTSVNNINVGDEVTIIGKQGGKCITADTAAFAVGTIGYEIVCLVGKRVPRFYLCGGGVVDVTSGLV